MSEELLTTRYFLSFTYGTPLTGQSSSVALNILGSITISIAMWITIKNS